MEIVGGGKLRCQSHERLKSFRSFHFYLGCTLWSFLLCFNHPREKPKMSVINTILIAGSEAGFVSDVPYIALVCCFKDTVPCEFFSSPSVLDHIFDANTRFYTHFWSLVIAFPPPLEEMEWTVKPSLTEKI